jgi:excisionase family DNA binding protein
VTGRLLTAREVADMLSVSSETVLRWTRKGQMPALRLPSGQIRYWEIDLESWLAANATVADTGAIPKAGPRGAATPTRALTTGESGSHG